MDRRSFFHTLAVAPVAAVAAFKATPVQALKFHPNAFALVSAPAFDATSGLAVNFIRHYDATAQPINRFDVLLGFGADYEGNGRIVSDGTVEPR